MKKKSFADHSGQRKSFGDSKKNKKRNRRKGRLMELKKGDKFFFKGKWCKVTDIADNKVKYIFPVDFETCMADREGKINLLEIYEVEKGEITKSKGED